MTENTPWIIERMRNCPATAPPTLEERRARHDAERERAKQEIEKAKRARAEWKVKWPNHCPHCEGHGGTYSEYDPSPAGVGLAPGTMTDYEPCEHCIAAQTDDGTTEIVARTERVAEDNIVRCWESTMEVFVPFGCCPRCHGTMDVSGEDPCPHCGWDWDHHPDDALPRIPEYDWETFADFDVILQMERAEEEAWNNAYRV